MADAATIDAIFRVVNTGLLGGNLAVMLRAVPSLLNHLREVQKQKLAERADDRAGWGDLIETQGAQIRALAEREHDCETRMAAMREAHDARMRIMEGEIEGLRRLVVMRSSSEGVQLSPTVAAAAERSVQYQIDRAGHANDGTDR